MRTCVLAHTETLPANKITKKSGKNRDGHLKQKKERTYALFQCVHAYMCTRSKKSQPKKEENSFFPSHWRLRESWPFRHIEKKG